MKFTATDFPGLLIGEPMVYGDDRGYFFESYNVSTFNKEGLSMNFVQDNQARSTYGVIRGLHYQIGSAAQTKLIRVLQGNILDVVVDLRKDAPTYQQSFSIELSAENQLQLVVPKGFAHGYAVLSETAEVLYKCDAFYNKLSEGGIIYNDPFLNIDWKIPTHRQLVSEKDQILPTIDKNVSNFYISEQIAHATNAFQLV